MFLSRHRLGPKLSQNKVAQELSIDKKTVQHWLSVYDNTSDVVEEQRQGRPRMTTPLGDEKLLAFAEEHAEASSDTIAKSLKRKRVEVSPRTVRRRLNEAGVYNLPPQFGPLLNKRLRKSRLQWAKRNKNRNWKRVVFTDETTFELYRKVRRVWRKKGQTKFVGTVKHPLKVNVWGCLSANGFGQIEVFTPNLTGPLLCSIYEKCLLPTAATAFGTNKKWMLQEDNDPKHQSRIAKKWRRENGVVRMDWASQSPDMNPIENVWAVLKANVSSHKPKNKRSLIYWIKREWGRLPNDYAQHLIESMNQRIEAVIARKGDNTRY